MTEADLCTSDTVGELATTAAGLVLATLSSAIELRGKARFVLAGGSTPLPLFRQLAERPRALDWSRVDFYWGDERCVPPQTEESNFRLAEKALLAPLGIKADRWARIRGELAPGAAAVEYDQVLAAVLVEDAWDLVLLGLGADGHTASLFPPRRREEEGTAWAVAAQAPSPPRARVSMTLRALNRARRVLFLVAGGSKAAALARVLAGDRTLHASAVSPPEGLVTWCVDRAATGALPPAVQSRLEH